MRFKKSVRVCAYWYCLLALPFLPRAGGVMRFTGEPPNPSYARKESNATLVWDYSVDNPQVKLQGIIHSVQVAGGVFTNMLGVPYNGTVIIFPTIPSAYKGRVRIEARASLVIENVTLQDNTAFMCTLAANPGAGRDVTSIVQLIVTVAPKIIMSSVHESYNEGSLVNITCTASGTPDPDVRWMRNGIEKRSGMKTAFLTFNSINRADDGQYTCRANNSAGNDENHLTLVVHYKPEGITLNTSVAGNMVTQGRSVTLTCHVTAAKPQVSRYRYYLNDTNLVKDSNDYQYTINNVQRSQHYGYYKCVPSNVVGDGPEATVSLYVNVPVQFTVFPQSVQVNETNTIVLSCDASGFPEPSFVWTKDGRVVSKSKQLNIQRSERSYSGIYVCTASNGVGKDKMAKAYVTVQYPPTIQEATSSTHKSWIGQAVTLRCVSDGVPTPTLTWYKPDGSQMNSITAAENPVNVTMSIDQDFGGYKCDADNGLTPADFKIVKIEQITKPGSPTMAQLDIQATSLAVKWTAPADDGGSPITAYRVVILKGSTEIKNVNITDPDTTSWNAGGLQRDTEYTVKVLAGNAVFEGPPVENKVKTKYKGVPAAATIDDLLNEVTDNTVTLKWSEPQNNGKVITQYTVYQRIVADGKPGEWTKLKTVTNIPPRELNVQPEQGNVYEFVVTAMSELGESLKEDGKIMRLIVKAFGVTPTIIKSSKTEVTVVDGNVLYLACEAEGFPAPSVTWKKNNKVLQTNINKTDFISDEASEKDAGKYECEASNSIGTVSYTVEVTIKASSSNEATLHFVYNTVVLVLLIIILVLIIVQRRLRTCAVKLNTSSKEKCAGSGGEFLELNPVTVKPDQQSSSNTASGDSGTYAAPSSADYMPLHPSIRSWEINRELVEIVKVVGKGAFSQVAKATAWSICDNEECTTVAVKMLKVNAPESDRRDLLSELELMKKLKPHPHVIKLMGCVTETDPLLVLIEYVPYGDLLGYLRKSRGLNDTYFKDPDVKPQTSLTAEQLMRFAWQVADGMLYLSSRKIIHRDLAARNVLVGEREKCKVTDFGMARNVQQDDIYTKQSRGRLPVKWTAYEALLYGTYTTQSDVWSYGVLLYEILTVGGSPYPGINARQIAMKLQEGYRMPKPKHVDNKLYQIMLKCWEENPNDRPTFAKLKNTMKEMERNHRTYVNLKQYDNSLYANVEDLTAE